MHLNVTDTDSHTLTNHVPGPAVEAGILKGSCVCSRTANRGIRFRLRMHLHVFTSSRNLPGCTGLLKNRPLFSPHAGQPLPSGMRLFRKRKGLVWNISFQMESFLRKDRKIRQMPRESGKEKTGIAEETRQQSGLRIGI